MKLIIPSVLLVVLGAGLARGVAPPGRYVLTATTVTDMQTGLIWERVESPMLMTWADAQVHCTLGWRLPEIRELLTLVDEGQNNPALDPIAFSGTAENYWSATLGAHDSTYAWGVNFAYGNTSTNLRSASLRARCVR